MAATFFVSTLLLIFVEMLACLFLWRFVLEESQFVALDRDI